MINRNEYINGFNYTTGFTDNDLSIMNKFLLYTVPEITINFEIDNPAIKEISNKIKFHLKSLKVINIDIFKKHSSEYSLSKESITNLGLKDESLIKLKQKEIKLICKKIKNIHSDYPKIGDLPDYEIEKLSNFNTKFKI